MSSASNYLELKLLDHALGTTVYTKPTSVYVALFTGNPTDTGLFTNEVSNSGTAYVRKLATFSSATNGAATNPAIILFPTATSSWGTITYIAICDSITRASGNILFYAPLALSRIITTGNTFQINAGGLVVTLD